MHILTVSGLEVVFRSASGSGKSFVIWLYVLTQPLMASVRRAEDIVAETKDANSENVDRIVAALMMSYTAASKVCGCT